MNLAILMVALCITLGGCGSKAVCVEGQSSPCACPNGAIGAQTCKADGTYEPCTCVAKRPPPAPKPVSAEELQQEVWDLDRKINETTDAVLGAQNDADRMQAKSKLSELRRQKKVIEDRLEQAKQAATLARPSAPSAP
jgi:hypothetical protein